MRWGESTETVPGFDFAKATFDMEIALYRILPCTTLDTGSPFSIT